MEKILGFPPGCVVVLFFARARTQVSYALVVALVLHAARQSTNTWFDQLPWFIRVAEKLTFMFGILWWFAGVFLMIIRALRIDQETMGLPLEQRDSVVPKLISLAQSRRSKDVLAFAHQLSCICIFFCIITLCFGIAFLGTSVSSSELAAAVVALCFGVPHAALALQRIAFGGGFELAFRAAAAEAAMLAPQFAVILACADATGPASWWQGALRLVSSALFAAALFLVASLPPRWRSPSVVEISESVLLDVIAFVMILQTFPYLRNDGMMYILMALVVACFLFVSFRESRSVVVEFVEPIMPLLATECAQPPSSNVRDSIRWSAHGMIVVNSLLMFQQMTQHHVAQSRTSATDDQWRPPEDESSDHSPGFGRFEDSDYFGGYAGEEASRMPSQDDLTLRW
ncbi:unnamed protein product [Symbiodinium natans]|uniref:Transmembrane protein n=1 Tax=Symbiodinium natans TaxID=878477 RepID=A0A812Q3R3_9DINO|nr:unnamed protein product [Symbiodinium natans]